MDGYALDLYDTIWLSEIFYDRNLMTGTLPYMQAYVGQGKRGSVLRLSFATVYSLHLRHHLVVDIDFVVAISRPFTAPVKLLGDFQ